MGTEGGGLGEWTYRHDEKEEDQKDTKKGNGKSNKNKRGGSRFLGKAIWTMKA